MTSTDILLIVKTLAIVVLTGFLCTALLYAILILRRIHRGLSATEERIGSMYDSWKDFYSRLLGLRTSLDVIASGCRAALSLYQRRMAKDIRDDGDDEEGEQKKTHRKGREKESD